MLSISPILYKYPWFPSVFAYNWGIGYSAQTGHSIVDLERIVFRCLEKDPTRRYQSMSELKEALEASTSVGTNAGWTSIRPFGVEPDKRSKKEGRRTFLPVNRIRFIVSALHNRGDLLARPVSYRFSGASRLVGAVPGDNFATGRSALIGSAGKAD